MDDRTSKEVALKLLAAKLAEDVKAVLEDHREFADAGNWRSYGGTEVNWDRVGVQSSQAPGAFTELIINSVDAILMRRALEEGISLRSQDAPQSMRDAVGRFFPEVREGNLANLSPSGREDLADGSVVVGVERGIRSNYIYPTYTIKDHGEGQNPSDFPATLLSLGRKNKEGIPFVQGRFNMGSTGSIPFCTRSNLKLGMYKLILSKRSPTLENADGRWGWTLIRMRKLRAGEMVPVAEYFAPDGEVPSFAADHIHVFPRYPLKGDGEIDEVSLLESGTVVRLYEYDIGPTGRRESDGLHNVLTANLMDIPLPVRTLDFDARQVETGRFGSAGIGRRVFSGMRLVLGSGHMDSREEGPNLERSIFVRRDSDNQDIGVVEVHAFGLRRMQDFLRQQPGRVFYTINGQAQAIERGSFFRRANLGGLRDHLIVEVRCDRLDGNARAVIFKPDRERKSDSEYSRILGEIVTRALRESRELRQYNDEVRQRRGRGGEEASRDHLEAILRQTPHLWSLFGGGTDIDPQRRPRQTPENTWQGRDYPTLFRFGGSGVVEVPQNGSRRVVFNTDASNDYLSREQDPGELIQPDPAFLPNTGGAPRDGRSEFRVRPWREARVGDERVGEFGFMDTSRPEPLTDAVVFRVVEAVDRPAPSPSPTPREPRAQLPTRALPVFQWVREEDREGHGFDANSGAKVDVDGEGATVFVYEGNRHLIALLQAELDESRRRALREAFLYGVGFLTLAMYRKMELLEGAADGELDLVEDVLPGMSSAIAEYVVGVMEAFGRGL